MVDNFTDIPFSLDNLDRYYIRSSIFRSLTEHMNYFHGHLLDIGCGKMPYKTHILQNSRVEKYVGLDIENAKQYDSVIVPDVLWDGVSMPFQEEEFDTAFGTEVLEHCPNPEVILNEVQRVLKSGGVFFFTVPFLWPLHEVPHDEFRYTPFSLQRLLESSGFEKIQIHATGGWHASMAQMLGLWVRRAPIPSGKRKILSRFLKPIIKYLIRIDKHGKLSFKEGQMISGLCGIAFKK